MIMNDIECPYCGQVFYKSIETCKAEEGVFTCTTCDKEFLFYKEVDIEYNCKKIGENNE